jgi:hypothetical protein
MTRETCVKKILDLVSSVMAKNERWGHDTPMNDNEIMEEALKILGEYITEQFT